jgi:hypothetical protein
LASPASSTLHTKLTPKILLLLLLLPLLLPQAGDSITFEWQFYGVGNQSCFHDGELLTKCISPLTIAAKASNGSRNHTLDVVITDVCGNRNYANYTYGAVGVVGLSTIDYVDVNEMVTEGALLTGGNGVQLNMRANQGNSAGALAACGVWTAAAAALVSSVVALLI